MLNSKKIKHLKEKTEHLDFVINTTLDAQQSQWKYIQALLDAEKQNRKELNTVIAKINQMKKTETKTKGKK